LRAGSRVTEPCRDWNDRSRNFGAGWYLGSELRGINARNSGFSAAQNVGV
jgi:hypothetical protein